MGIRTSENSLVTLPNANLINAAVDSRGKRAYRRWKTTFGLTYDTPPEKIEAFCEGVRELIQHHPQSRKDGFEVRFHQFGPASLDVLMYMFFDTREWSVELESRHRLGIDILRLAERLGVEFAFPTQTIHLVQPEPASKRRQSEPTTPPASRPPKGRSPIGRGALLGLLTAGGSGRRPGSPGCRYNPLGSARGLVPPAVFKTVVPRGIPRGGWIRFPCASAIVFNNSRHFGVGRGCPCRTAFWVSELVILVKEKDLPVIKERWAARPSADRSPSSLSKEITLCRKRSSAALLWR